MRFEKALIIAINKKLPKSIHHQSMTGASMMHNGIPDQYYDGPASDLWVEYKLLTTMPRSGTVGAVDKTKRGCYSPLQYAWMERRHRNSLSHGRANVIGIVGLPNRMVVIQTTPAEWREGSPITSAIPLEAASAWILGFCSQSYAS